MTFFYSLNCFSQTVLKTFTNYNFTMNEPRTPLDNKDWNDINIFLFSNGQQSSPPRKYHLKADELELWESTVHYLARTQYGSLHSTIELYTLDGKKINSPLELIDATSYVAVKPPDMFIPGGYQQYLIKASRSWEKRQEKLNNMADVTGEIKVINTQSKTAVDEFKDNETTNIKNPKSLMEKDFDSISTNNTIILRQRKETDRSLEEKQREYKPFLTRKSVDSDKIKIIKKNPPQISEKSSKDDSIISKKRILSVTKNFKNSSSRRQSMATKSDRNNTKTNIVDNPKEKIQPNITKSPEETEIKEIIVLSKPSYFNENQSQEVSNSGLDKVLVTSSDVFKNPDSEVQSIYIDAERKIITREDLSQEKPKSHELHKIDELNDELITSQKDNKAISVQSISYSNDKNESDIRTAKILNIKLNIEVRDSHRRCSAATERSGRLGKCKSYTALLTAEQESQADININLKDEDFKIDNSMPIKKSIFTNKAYLKSDDGDTKVIVWKCMCGSLETPNVNNKSKENYIILVPTTFADKNDESCRCSPDNNQPADKDFLKQRQSIVNTESQNLRTNTNSRDNSQITMKHKVSICPDSPIKISEEMPSQIKKHFLNIIANKKVDQFTQTEWCNNLLQVRHQADGYSSFHFPPLHVLAQYNLL